jgi:sulfite reductase alpha subunit-like flavoprotein
MLRRVCVCDALVRLCADVAFGVLLFRASAASPSVPIIMVGPGTGLAPFRSFIAHRQLADADAADADASGDENTPVPTAGEAVLFFGCRHRAKDYLYGAALEAWAAEGAITLHTAFSRDGPEKVYVQQRVAEAGDALHEALTARGAHFYVCGDANAMAGDVDKALRALLAERMDGGAEEADAFVAALEAAGRYQRDVWFS